MATIQVSVHEEIKNPILLRRRKIIWQIILPLILGGFIAAGLFIKVDRTIAVQGFVLSDEHSLIRAPAGAVVKEILVKNGDEVIKGRELIRLEDPQIKAKLEVIRDKLKKSPDDPQLQLEQSQLNERQENLLIRAPQAGQILLKQLQPGDSLAKGQLLIEIFGKSRVAHLHIPESYSDLAKSNQLVLLRFTNKSYTDQECQIRELSPVVASDPTKSYRLAICPLEENTYRIGSSCRAWITLGKTSLFRQLLGI